MYNLKNKVVLISGGSRGIGKAIATKLAQNGANIALTYLGNKEKALSVCNEIKLFTPKTKAFYCDVSNFEDTKNLIDSVMNEFGTIDILINNAGVTGKNALTFSLSTDEFDSIINTNLKGTFNMCKNIYPIFVKKHSGKIINIASVAGISGIAGQSIYSASKAGIIGFSKSLAKELASRNITCNIIAPGFVETDMTQDIKDSIKNTIPMKRLASPDDIANVAAFLSSDCSNYITGEVIKIDGGLCI